MLKNDIYYVLWIEFQYIFAQNFNHINFMNTKLIRTLLGVAALLCLNFSVLNAQNSSKEFTAKPVVTKLKAGFKVNGKKVAIPFPKSSEIDENLICQLDSIIYEEDTRLIYENNSFGQPDKITVYWWDGTAWEVAAQGIFTYDANGNVLTFETYYWNGSSFDANEKETYTYDANGNVLTYTYAYWNGSAWEDSDRTTYTYNANGQITTETLAYWNGSGWDSSHRTSYTYNGDGTLNETLYQDWWGASWETSTKYVNQYTAGVLTTQVEYYWDGTNFVLSGRNVYTYDGSGNMTELVYEYYDGICCYENGNRNQYAYDANGNVTSEHYAYWDGTEWVDTDQYNYTYDEHGNVTAISYAYYESGQWVDQGTEQYYYSCFVGVEDITDVKGLKVYPNPSNDVLNFEWVGNENVAIELMDISGKVVYSTQVNGNIIKGSMNVSKLAPGVYALRVFGASTYITENVIVK